MARTKQPEAVHSVQLFRRSVADAPDTANHTAESIHLLLKLQFGRARSSRLQPIERARSTQHKEHRELDREPRARRGEELIEERKLTRSWSSSQSVRNRSDCQPISTSSSNLHRNDYWCMLRWHTLRSYYRIQKVLYKLIYFTISCTTCPFEVGRFTSKGTTGSKSSF